ncbi:hypothetical protein T07_13195 [Trichinella nelsoni]|uniref:Uncharacterized protein n=1 Tax=Trichinella nelsoni TaxID=6336 RepID=A0A0V0SCJ7_9BILA|nr:hypothetical protein T07_13195 [Trichinella nelsoni]
MIAQLWPSISGSTLRVPWNKPLDVDVSDKSDEDMSHSEAYFCLKVGLMWMEQQNVKFSAIQLILTDIIAISLHRRSYLRSNRNLLLIIKYDTK